MKYGIVPTSKFKKDLKRMKDGGYDISLLTDVVNTIATGKNLAPKHRDHPLKGKLKGYRDCHIQDNWVLIYKKDDDRLILVLMRTGTHSQLKL